MAHRSSSTERPSGAPAVRLLLIGTLWLTSCTSSVAEQSTVVGEVPDDARVCIDYPDGPETGSLCITRAGGVLRLGGSGLMPGSAVDIAGGVDDTKQGVVDVDGGLDLEIGDRLTTPPFSATSTWNTGEPAELTTAWSESAGASDR